MMRALRVLILVAVMAVVAGCTSSRLSPGDIPSPPSVSGDLRIFAAAPLENVFNQLIRDFENSHPGVNVILTVGGPNSLADQILSGTPADIFASADMAPLERLSTAGKVGPASLFATNLLVLAVPSDNPAQIESIEDLGADARTIMCTPDEPCGAIAARLCASAGLTLTPASLEPTSTAVTAKLIAGDADAGFVYVTDVLASKDKLLKIDIPVELVADAKIWHPIAVVEDAARKDLADLFMYYIVENEARAILLESGFGLS